MDSDNRYQVLILDDDYELGAMLKEFLQSHIPCTVTFVTREVDFWRCQEQNKYDILFLDYKLSDTTGLEVLARINQKGLTIPTVMMSGEGSENVAARAIQLGAVDYLVKGEYSFSNLPPLIQKAVRLRNLQQSMQHYLEQVRYQATLLNNMRDAVVVWGLDGKITYWNHAASQLYHSTEEERLGRSVEEVYYPCFDPPIQLDTLQPARSNPLEHRYLLEDGQSIWVSSHISPLISSEDDHLTFGYMDVARDITPRKLEQENLVQSQNFIQRILDTSPNVIYILELQDRILRYINPEVEPILGYSPDEFTQAPFQHFLERVHPDESTDIENHLNALSLLKEGEVSEIEYRFQSKGGDWRWLKSCDAIFSQGENGAPLEIIGMI